MRSSSGGSGSPTLRSARLRSSAMNASGRSVSSSANASARASTRRDSALRGAAERRRRRAPAPAPAPGSPGRGPARRVEALPAANRSASRWTRNIPAGATSASQSRPRGTSSVRHVAELVGDHRAHLVVREVLDQVVVEHHALRVPEPADVGVDPGGPAARVDAVDLPHVDAGLVGQREHVASAARPWGSRSNLLKIGSITTGQEVEREHGERHHHDRRGAHQRAREAPHQASASAPPRGREDRVDARRLRHVRQPGPSAAWTARRRPPARGARSPAAGPRAPARRDTAPPAAPRPLAAPAGGRRSAARRESRRETPFPRARATAGTRGSRRRAPARRG